MDDKTLKRFFAKTKLATEIRPGMATRCLEWTASKTQNGYGRFALRAGKTVRAHRLVYEMEHDSIPEELCVLHRCDNPSCVAADHLFVGTHINNMSDMVQKNRQASGDRNGSRLHPECLSRGDDHSAVMYKVAARGNRSGARLHPERLARGDLHPARLHPERMARGDRHGSHLHPERMARGEQHYKAKLNEGNVRFIFWLREEGWILARLSAEFGVSVAQIQKVLARQVWAHVKIG